MLAAAAVVMIVGGSVHATLDAPVDAGEVTIVDANNRSRLVVEGDSNTVFSVRVPDGATCPGDSANDDWRVQSFVIPADVDPGALEYRALRPIGDNFHALYGADTRPYIQAFLGQNAGPGQPGQVLEAPPLSFAVFPAGLLPEGNYRIGVACTYFRDTAKYWDTEIVLTADPSVQPGELRWRVADDVAAGAVGDADGGSASSAVVPLGIVAAALTAGFLAVRSRRKSRTPSKEMSS